jgi:NitT/TauT family transport system permease protein
VTAAATAVRGRRSARTRRRLSIGIGRIVLLAAFVLVWQWGSNAHLFDPGVVSSPGAIWQHLVTWSANGTLWFHSAITVEETVLGFLIGSVAGIVLGFAIGQNRALAELLDPFILALYSIPKVALAPLFIVWFGIGMPMKVILAAVTVLFIVFFNTLAGVRNVDRDLVDAIWMMGGKRAQILRYVIVPSALGWALTGVRIAIPYALIGAIIGELIASNRGIGYLIASSGSQYDTAGVFAALIVLTILAIVLNGVVDQIDRRTSAWKTDSTVNVRGA